MSGKVGNDVVDLSDAADSHLSPRFVARVCAQSERVLLAASPAPKQLLWSLFAAKEAAFKVVSKLGPRPVFAHRKFVVAGDLRAVTYEGRVLSLWLEQAEGYVHALVSDAPQRPAGAVEPLPPGTEPSAAARALLVRQLGLWGSEVLRDPLPGSWDGFGPPRLSPPGPDISLSHHGRFVACAAQASFASR